jgi:phage terminase large subunit GpA-like protein
VSRIWETLARAVGTAFVTREKLNLWQWSDKFVILDSRFAARPGKYDSAYTFYIRGVMEALSDRRIRQVTVVKGAQIAFTTTLANFVMYLVDMEPGPTLLAQPSRKIVRRYVKKELHPRFLGCDRLKKYIPADRKTKFQTEEMYFTSMDFFATGVGSPALLASLPIKNALGDEIDKWDLQNDIEASRKDLLEVRLITYQAQGTSKLVLGSTPTIPEYPISTEALKGSQERFFVPCPECRAMQELKFENFAWRQIKHIKNADGSYNLDLVQKHTCCECQHCHALIPHEKKQWMMRRGEWRAQNPNAPADHRSFYIGGELSTALTWGMLAKKFLETQLLPGGLHNFYNSYLGRAWERKAGGATRKSIQLIQEASPKFNLGNPQERDAELTLPFRPVALTMQVDCQQTSFFWTMRAWTADGSRAVIALGECVSYKELVEISNRKWKYWHPNDNGMCVSPQSGTGGVEKSAAPASVHPVPEEFEVWTGLIDSGYKAKATTGVYNFVHEQGGRWIGTKGGKFGGKDLPIHETTVLHLCDSKQVEIPLFHYNDAMMKEHLYRFVIRERRQPPYWLPRDLPSQFIEQITAERLVPKKDAEGRTEMKWHSEIDPHYGDCEKIGEIFHFVLNPEIRAQIRAKQDATRATLMETLAI